MATETTQSFHLFSQLPIELRLRIYQFALTPRTVPVRLKLDLDAWNWSVGKDWWTCYAVVADAERPSAPLPPVLGARYEAWAELEGLYGGLEIDQDILKTLLVPRRQRNREEETNNDDEIEDEKEEEAEEGGGGGGDDDDDDSEPLTERLVENLLSHRGKHRRPRFNADHDILEWREPRRWVCCGDQQLRTLVHPLFLAATLSVRRVSIEYVSCMADLLEVMALAVLDSSSGSRLDTLDISVKNPSDCRVLRFRLCRLPQVTRLDGKRELPGRVMDPVEDRPQDIDELVRRHGLVWFPWARDSESDRNNSVLPRQGGDDASAACETRFRSIMDKIARNTALAPPGGGTQAAAPTDSSLHPFLPPSQNLARAQNAAILQVLAETDPTTGPGASGTWARIGALREDPAQVKVQYPHHSAPGDEPLSFGAEGDVRIDVLLWCHMLKLHGAGYPANLPFNIVGVPCHGFCNEAVGMC